MLRKPLLRAFFTKCRRMIAAGPHVPRRQWRIRRSLSWGKVNPALLIVIVVVIAILLLPLLGRRKGPIPVVSNSGFEMGSGVPTGWNRGVWPAGQTVSGVEYTWAKGTAHTGDASICLEKSAQRYFPVAQWCQAVPKKKGATELRVSAWVKAQQAYKATVDIQYPGGHEWAAYIGGREDGDPPADHDWQKYSGTVSIPPDIAEFTIALQIYGPGTVWFDDVEVEYID